MRPTRSSTGASELSTCSRGSPGCATVNVSERHGSPAMSTVSKPSFSGTPGASSGTSPVCSTT